MSKSLRLGATSHTAVVEQWLVTFTSASTQAAYRRDLVLFLQWLADRGHDVFAVNESVFAQYREFHTTMTASSATVHRRLSSVSSFYRFAVESKHVASNPAGAPRNVMLTPRSTTAQLSVKEVTMLWDSAARHSPRAAAIVGLLLFDGLKLFELLALDVADVVGPATRVRLALTRNGRLFSVPVDDRTAPSLLRLRRGRREGPLFLGESATVGGSRLTRFGADYLIKQVGALAELNDPLTANRLRSTHIATALAQADDAESVRVAVGHADRRTTLRFLRTLS